MVAAQTCTRKGPGFKSFGDRLMSALSQKQTSRLAQVMSALGQKQTCAAPKRCPLSANSGYRTADRAGPAARRVSRADAGTRRPLLSRISLADRVW